MKSYLIQMKYYLIKMKLKLIWMKLKFISMKLNFMYFFIGNLIYVMSKKAQEFSFQRMKSHFN